MQLSRRHPPPLHSQVSHAGHVGTLSRRSSMSRPCSRTYRQTCAEPAFTANLQNYGACLAAETPFSNGMSCFHNRTHGLAVGQLRQSRCEPGQDSCRPSPAAKWQPHPCRMFNTPELAGLGTKNLTHGNMWWALKLVDVCTCHHKVRNVNMSETWAAESHQSERQSQDTSREARWLAACASTPGAWLLPLGPCRPV